jgi:Flp pilus assembly protein TadG
MAQRNLLSLLNNTSAAVAPTVALSLFGLIAAGGLAFDYARMASLDTELQNAADQAALAAASQLDGQVGARARATSAAQTLVINQTRFANDGNASNRTITVPTLVFYQSYNKATDTPGAVADSDANARFVQVTTGNREAVYALTPIVDAVRSGNLSGAAVAGLGAAICKVPPVMMCNPAEATDPDFTTGNYIGRGIRLVANDGGGGYGPGLFGFLETGAGSGASALGKALGQVTPPGDCVESTGVDPSPGNMQSVRAEFNTRFDIFENGINSSCGNTGLLCPPSFNTRKDVVISGNNPSGQAPFQTGNGNNGNIWRLPTTPDTQHYPPVALATTRYLTSTEIADLWPMGHPRDVCHAVSNTGNCPLNKIGSGDWDRNAYFRSNSQSYPSVPNNTDLTNWFGTTTPTRYQVYRWEITNAATRLVSQSQGGNGNNARTSAPQPVNRTGITPSASTVDRRRLSVAVINCTANSVGASSTDVPVQKWVDVFLVEPSLPRPRTEQSDIYVEVIEQTATAGGGGTAGQVVRRDTPYLIK